MDSIRVPRMFCRFWPKLAILLVIGGLWGCESPKGGDRDEQKNPHFIEGKERAKARDYKGAIEAFQRALDANPDSTLAHFELGMLYETHDEQNEWRYVLALYHYYRAYELRPNAYPADNAKMRIQACRQELAKTESLAPLYPSMQRELEKLRQENWQLRRQVDFLQTQALARAAAPEPSSSSATAHPQGRSERSDRIPASAQSDRGNSGTSRKHTVRERETMASIARTYRLRVESVMAANPAVQPKRLRAGQTLNIPAS
jgi:tetratricopeptide (TPR) repeat protein